jgi:ABC-type glycerol-3-phosphate transport system permease component
VQLLTITTAGYVFACHEFRGKQTLFLMFLVQLMIMPVVMMVPNMLTLKTFGLLNPHRGDDALLHLGVRRVPDASGVSPSPKSWKRRR